MEEQFAKVMGGDGGDRETSGCQMHGQREIGSEFSQQLLCSVVREHGQRI